MVASLIGYGNHGRDISAVWTRCARGVLGIYDEDPRLGILPPSNLDGCILIGINDSALRFQVSQHYEMLDGCTPLIDPSAIIGPNVQLSNGVVIAPSATLLHSVELGHHTHLNYGVSMTRCSIGAFGTVSPGAIICGNVSIGDECTIGAGAVICERTTIGSRVTVAAGAVVPPYSVVPDDTKIIGVWKG